MGGRRRHGILVTLPTAGGEHRVGICEGKHWADPSNPTVRSIYGAQRLLHCDASLRIVSARRLSQSLASIGGHGWLCGCREPGYCMDRSVGGEHSDIALESADVDVRSP